MVSACGHFTFSKQTGFIPRHSVAKGDEEEQSSISTSEDHEAAQPCLLYLLLLVSFQYLFIIHFNNKNAVHYVH